MDLSVNDLFKAYLHLEPSETQFLNAIIAFPWAIKLVYGILSDSVPFYGSRKRSYYILNSVLAVICLIPLIFKQVEYKYLVVFLLTA